VVYHNGSNGTNCPQFWFYGGEFNGTVYTNRALNQFYGGTFKGSLQMSVDSSAYALIAGGTFAKLSNLYGSALNSDKFTIGSSKGANNGSVCIDENGYYVITTTTPANAEASVASNYNSNNYFYYSTVNTNGMYYEDVYDALEANKTGTVTVFTDELIIYVNVCVCGCAYEDPAVFFSFICNGSACDHTVSLSGLALCDSGIPAYIVKIICKSLIFSDSFKDLHVDTDDIALLILEFKRAKAFICCNDKFLALSGLLSLACACCKNACRKNNYQKKYQNFL
jgi:hypothetical protein